MGKKKKETFADKLKASISKAGDEVAKATKKTLEVAKESADVVAEQTAKAAKASAKAAQAGAHLVAEKAGDAKDFLDEKTRSGLDQAYSAKQKLAKENLARLRKANPNGTPSEILSELEADLVKAEAKNGDDSEEFASATAMYIFTAVEIYGEQVKDQNSRQKLIDATVMLDSSAAKIAAKVAGIGLAVLMARTGTKGALGSIAKKAASATAFVALLGIKNPGKKSATWIAVSAVNKFLGTPPADWPKA